MFNASSLLLALSTVLLSTACQAQPKVTISTKEERELTFEVEIADTPVKRELGFQYRRELALLDEKHADSAGFAFYQ